MTPDCTLRPLSVSLPLAAMPDCTLRPLPLPLPLAAMPDCTLLPLPLPLAAMPDCTLRPLPLSLPLLLAAMPDLATVGRTPDLYPVAATIDPRPLAAAPYPRARAAVSHPRPVAAVLRPHPVAVAAALHLREVAAARHPCRLAVARYRSPVAVARVLDFRAVAATPHLGAVAFTVRPRGFAAALHLRSAAAKPRFAAITFTRRPRPVPAVFSCRPFAVPQNFAAVASAPEPRPIATAPDSRPPAARPRFAAIASALCRPVAAISRAAALDGPCEVSQFAPVSRLRAFARVHGARIVRRPNEGPRPFGTLAAASNAHVFAPARRAPVLDHTFRAAARDFRALGSAPHLRGPGHEATSCTPAGATWANHLTLNTGIDRLVRKTATDPGRLLAGRDIAPEKATRPPAFKVATRRAGAATSRRASSFDTDSHLPTRPAHRQHHRRAQPCQLPPRRSAT